MEGGIDAVGKEMTGSGNSLGKIDVFMQEIKEFTGIGQPEKKLVENDTHGGPSAGIALVAGLDTLEVIIKRNGKVYRMLCLCASYIRTLSKVCHSPGTSDYRYG